MRILPQENTDLLNFFLKLHLAENKHQHSSYRKREIDPFAEEHEEEERLSVALALGEQPVVHVLYVVQNRTDHPYDGVKNEDLTSLLQWEVIVNNEICSDIKLVGAYAHDRRLPVEAFGSNKLFDEQYHDGDHLEQKRN